MPAYIRQLTPDGLIPVDYEAASLADAVRHEPDGVYTVTNTHNKTQALKLDAHFTRLEDSARREQIPLTIDRPRTRAALRQAVLESGYDNARFRLTVPRATPDRPILTLEPFTPPSAAVYENGVAVITCPHGKRSNPAAKTTEWMEARSAIQDSFAPGIYEGLLLNERGDILEGLGSNFYAILDGRLHTAREGVLPGIAQQIVLEIAPAIIPVDERPVHVDDVPRLDEAFISSASRGIVPVVRIDDTPVSGGAPGPITLALHEAYQVWVKAHLDEL